MTGRWKENQRFLLQSISSYRKLIENKDLTSQKKVTEQFALNLHQSTPQLQHRSIQSIIERLPYLDNLLAGIFERHNYAQKDQDLFGSNPRKNESNKANKCNPRLTYNGALR